MRIGVITIFPEYFESPLGLSIIGRAIDSGALSVDLIDLRDFAEGVHRKVDDAPFGGGAGMVMMVEPLAASLRAQGNSHKILLSPVGVPLDQAKLDELAKLDDLTLVCGRYEGVDQRIADHFVDEEVSLGDYVLAGGEAAALVVIEGVARLLAGVLGNPRSIESESHRDGLLEEPMYTRPADFEGLVVPEVLLSGDHAAIEQWRRRQRLERTRTRRPDLL